MKPTQPKDCDHPKLYFQSGTYYIYCEKCMTRWVALDPTRTGNGPNGETYFDYTLGRCLPYGEDYRVVPAETKVD